MSFIGFSQRDFDTFHIEGLEGRMEAIRERIQPKFQALGEALVDDVAMMAGTEMHVHIAQHARRTINAPKDTWMAFSPSKKGYKMHPHFQIGLFDDHLFFWLALIYELPLKKSIAQTYLDHLDEVHRLIPPEYVLSFDHMNKETVRAGDLSGEQLKEALVRFRDVKKAELLIGRHIQPDDRLLSDPRAFVQSAADTFRTLAPLYRMASGSGVL